MKRAAVVVMAVLLGVVLGAPASSASAHAYLARSNPEAGAVLDQPPAHVLLWFSEGIELAFSRAELIDSKGKRYDNDDFHLHFKGSDAGFTSVGDEPNGTYTIVWDVISSVDGHRTKGTVPFFVGPPPDPSTTPASITVPDIGPGSGPPAALAVFARWGNFAGMAALIGVALFPFLVLARGFGALAMPAEDSAQSRRDDGEAIAWRGLRTSMLVATIVLLAATLASIWLQVWSAGGSATSTSLLDDVLFHTRFGDIWTLRAAFLGVVALSVLMLPREGARPWQHSILHKSNTRWLLLAAIAVALPATTSLNSHAAAQGSNDLPTIVDWAHLVAGGVWVGGLLQLLIAVVFVVPRLEDRAGFLGPLIRRFSIVAIASVAVIVVTGVIQSIDRLDSISELADTTYGLTLLAKIMLLMPLLAFGTFNLLRIGPRFVALARAREGGGLSRLWQGRFRFTVAAEVALATTILAITAILTNSSPPQGSAEQFTQTGGPVVAVDSDDLNIALWADPARVGTNEINVFLKDKDGDERTIQRVILRVQYLDQSLGVEEIDAEALHPPSHYVAKTSQFSLAGKWQVEVIVRREGLRDTSAKIPLDIQP